jgi:hypothetical protein
VGIENPGSTIRRDMPRHTDTGDETHQIQKLCLSSIKHETFVYCCLAKERPDVTPAMILKMVLGLLQPTDG